MSPEDKHFRDMNILGTDFMKTFKCVLNIDFDAERVKLELFDWSKYIQRMKRLGLDYYTYRHIPYIFPMDTNTDIFIDWEEVTDEILQHNTDEPSRYWNT